MPVQRRVYTYFEDRIYSEGTSEGTSKKKGGGKKRGGGEDGKAVSRGKGL